MLLLFMILLGFFSPVLAQSTGKDEDLSLLTAFAVVLGAVFLFGAKYFQKRLDAQLEKKLQNHYQLDESRVQNPVDSVTVSSLPTDPNTKK